MEFIQWWLVALQSRQAKSSTHPVKPLLSYIPLVLSTENLLHPDSNHKSPFC